MIAVTTVTAELISARCRLINGAGDQPPVSQPKKRSLMKNWKPLLEKALAKEYPGATIKWDGDHPKIVVPDELKNETTEIIEYTTALWEAWGGDPREDDV